MSPPRELAEDLLPPHKAELILTHNPHLTNYETVAEYLGRLGESDFVNGAAGEAAAIERNELWVLQWYPDTPVGFWIVHAATFADLVGYMERRREEGWA